MLPLLGLHIAHARWMPEHLLMNNQFNIETRLCCFSPHLSMPSWACRYIWRLQILEPVVARRGTSLLCIHWSSLGTAVLASRIGLPQVKSTGWHAILPSLCPAKIYRGSLMCLELLSHDQPCQICKKLSWRRDTTQAICTKAPSLWRCNIVQLLY